jgi:hypothetical protein
VKLRHQFRVYTTPSQNVKLQTENFRKKTSHRQLPELS